LIERVIDFVRWLIGSIGHFARRVLLSSTSRPLCGLPLSWQSWWRVERLVSTSANTSAFCSWVLSTVLFPGSELYL